MIKRIVHNEFLTNGKLHQWNYLHPYSVFSGKNIHDFLFNSKHYYVIDKIVYQDYFLLLENNSSQLDIGLKVLTKTGKIGFLAISRSLNLHKMVKQKS
jgi:hypothetical protein